MNRLKKVKISILVILVLLTTLIPSILFAQSKYITLGISLGEPTSVVGRWQFNPNQAIEVDLGATLLRPFFRIAYDNRTLYDVNKIKVNLGLSYVYNFFLTREWDLPLYLGAGINVRFESSRVTRFGITLPTIGLEKMFQSGALKWGICTELSLITNLTPEGQGLIDWIGSWGNPDINTLSLFYDTFDIQFSIGMRFYIPI